MSKSNQSSRCSIMTTVSFQSSFAKAWLCHFPKGVDAAIANKAQEMIKGMRKGSDVMLSKEGKDQDRCNLLQFLTTRSYK